MTADIALLREAGGLGDVIRLSSVGRWLKRREVGAKVTAYILPQFTSAVARLEGVDAVVPVKLQLRLRRARCTDWRKALYLTSVVKRSHTHVYDMFCPGFLGEMRGAPPVLYSRSELFCQAAGMRLPTTEDVRPVWETRPEDVAAAELLNIPPNAVGLALRATDSARSVHPERIIKVARQLTAAGYAPYVIDSERHFPTDGIGTLVGYPIEVVAAALRKFHCIIAVCSGILHLAGALGVRCVGVFGPTDPAVMLKHYPTHTAVVADGYATAKPPHSPCLQPCWFRPSAGWKAELCRPNGCYWINRVNWDTVVDGVIHIGQGA